MDEDMKNVVEDLKRENKLLRAKVQHLELQLEANKGARELERLRSMIRSLEDMKGVTAAMIEIKKGRLTGVVTAPGMDEEKAAAFMALIVSQTLALGGYEYAAQILGQETADVFWKGILKGRSGEDRDSKGTEG